MHCGKEPHASHSHNVLLCGTVFVCGQASDIWNLPLFGLKKQRMTLQSSWITCSRSSALSALGTTSYHINHGPSQKFMLHLLSTHCYPFITWLQTQRWCRNSFYPSPHPHVKLMFTLCCKLMLNVLSNYEPSYVWRRFFRYSRGLSHLPHLHTDEIKTVDNIDAHDKTWIVLQRLGDRCQSK